MPADCRALLAALAGCAGGATLEVHVGECSGPTVAAVVQATTARIRCVRWWGQEWWTSRQWKVTRTLVIKALYLLSCLPPPMLSAAALLSWRASWTACAWLSLHCLRCRAAQVCWGGQQVH